MTEIDFAYLKNQANWYIEIQIVLNILCQFSAHTLMLVIINKYVNFVSIGFFVVELVIIETTIDFAYSKNQTDWYIQIQIVLDVLC